MALNHVYKWMWSRYTQLITINPKCFCPHCLSANTSLAAHYLSALLTCFTWLIPYACIIYSKFIFFIDLALCHFGESFCWLNLNCIKCQLNYGSGLFPVQTWFIICLQIRPRFPDSLIIWRHSSGRQQPLPPKSLNTQQEWRLTTYRMSFVWCRLSNY